MVANAKKDELSLTPMLNAYPDSLGGTLSDIADLLESSCKAVSYTHLRAHET